MRSGKATSVNSRLMLAARRTTVGHTTPMPVGPVLLGCVADDLTGATDLGDTLVRAGLRTTLWIGPPDADPGDGGRRRPAGRRRRADDPATAPTR